MKLLLKSVKNILLILLNFRNTLHYTIILKKQVVVNTFNKNPELTSFHLEASLVCTNFQEVPFHNLGKIREILLSLLMT